MKNVTVTRGSWRIWWRVALRRCWGQDVRSLGAELTVCDVIGSLKTPPPRIRIQQFKLLRTELTNHSAETHAEGLAPFQWSHFLQLLQLNRIHASVRFQAETFLYPVSDKIFVFNNIASAKNLGPLATLGGCDHPEDNEV